MTLELCAPFGVLKTEKHSGEVVLHLRLTGEILPFVFGPA